MHLAIVDSHGFCERTASEAALLQDAGIRLTLISPPRSDGGRPLGIPAEVDWLALPTGRAGVVALLAASAKFDAVHNHCGLALHGVVRLAASLANLRFVADFNSLLVPAQPTPEAPEATAAGGTFDEQHWDRAPSEHERQRIQETLDFLPTQAAGVLDVGCGDGRITNPMGRRFGHVVGCDGSKAGLARLDGAAALGRVDALPFRSGAFDLVTCFEVLEHLPDPVLGCCVAELARVSRRELVIGVPLSETLALRDLRCDRCGHTFNQTGHLRSFRRRDLAALVPGFGLVEFRECGAPQRPYYNRALLWARQQVAGVYRRTPGIRCPRCRAPLAAAARDERTTLVEYLDSANTRLRQMLPLSRSHCLARYRRF